MHQHSLHESIIRAFASNQLQLPAFPAVAMKLQQALQDPKTRVTDLEAMIVGDQALASQILRAANSSLYQGLQHITTIQKAIIRLGVRQVATLAMALSQRGLYLLHNPLLNHYLEKLWQHAFASAMGSQWLARRCGYPSQADNAFLAGLLHNIGQLVILRVMDELHVGRNPDEDDLPETLLHEILNSNVHNAQGYVLMKRWNVPEEYCTVARDHHKEPYDSTQLLLLIVRLVDQACEKLGIGLHQGDAQISLAATQEAQTLGLKEVMLAEMEILLEDGVTMAGQI